MEKTYHLHCKQCGRQFTGNFPAMRYCCESCRETGYRESRAASEAAQRRRRQNRLHEYTCRKCGRRIGVLGGSSGRKYCDGCLARHMGAYGLRVLSQRRDLPERAIYPDKKGE